MQFNKLYKLILQSIITQDIQSKIKKAIQTLIKSGQLKNENDPRVQQIKTIIKRNNSIDINGKTKLDQLLKANQTLINRAQVKKDNYLDSIPQFTQKKEFPKGVVVYHVEDSKEGQLAVRKIVDAQWGEDTNPWCLITGHGAQLTKNYNQYWKHYSAYPKHIAFQNGKLLAFCAYDKPETVWWDRNDKKYTKLPLLDGSLMQVDYYGYSKEQIQKARQKEIMQFIYHQGLHYDEKTGLYNSDGDVKICDYIIENGVLPVKMGIIRGDLTVYAGLLNSLQGMPKVIEGVCRLYENQQMTSLKGCEDTIVKQDFICRNWKGLKDLQYAPKSVGGSFYCDNCTSLTSLNNIEKRVKGTVYYGNCPNLPVEDIAKRFIKTYHLKYNKQTGRYDHDTSSSNFTFSVMMILEDGLYQGEIPVPLGVVNDNMELRFVNLKSFKNFPTKITGYLRLNHVKGIQNLKGITQEVEDDFYVQYCQDLTSNEGAPTHVGGISTYANCDKLSKEFMLKNFIERHGLVLNKQTNRYDYNHGMYVHIYASDLEDGHFKIPLGKIDGNFVVDDNLNRAFTSLFNGPIEVTGKFDISNNRGIKSLQYAPTKVGGDFILNHCYGLQTLQGGPKEVGGNYIITWCYHLHDLKGAPKIINQDLLMNHCRGLSSLNDGPEQVKGSINMTDTPNLNKEIKLAWKKKVKAKKK